MAPAASRTGVADNGRMVSNHGAVAKAARVWCQSAVPEFHNAAPVPSSHRSRSDRFVADQATLATMPAAVAISAATRRPVNVGNESTGTGTGEASCTRVMIRLANPSPGP